MMASWYYSPFYNHDEIVKQVARPNVIDAIDNACHTYEDNKASHRWKRLLLEFPSGHKLLSKLIYDKAGDDEELALELLPFSFSHTPGLPNPSAPSTMSSGKLLEVM
jgi:hypothetical protein